MVVTSSLTVWANHSLLQRKRRSVHRMAWYSHSPHPTNSSTEGKTSFHSTTTTPKTHQQPPLRLSSFSTSTHPTYTRSTCLTSVVSTSPYSIYLTSIASTFPYSVAHLRTVFMFPHSIALTRVTNPFTISTAPLVSVRCTSATFMFLQDVLLLRSAVGHHDVRQRHFPVFGTLTTHGTCCTFILTSLLLSHLL